MEAMIAIATMLSCHVISLEVDLRDVPRQIEAPAIVTDRTVEAEALARAMLIHDRCISTIEYKVRLTQPEIGLEKGINQVLEVRIDDRGRHRIRYDYTQQWTGGVDPRSRKPMGLDLTQMHNHGEWVACLTEINKNGGVRPAQREIHFAGSLHGALGRELEYTVPKRRLGDILLASTGLIIAKPPDDQGIATLRCTTLLDAHRTTIEVDVATRHGFVCVGVRRFDTSFNALKSRIVCHKLMRVDETWVPSLVDDETLTGAHLPESDAGRFVAVLTESGLKEGMNFATPDAQAALRKAYIELFGKPHYPMIPLTPMGPTRMEMVEVPMINRELTRDDLSISLPGIVLWVNDMTGEVNKIDLTKYPEDQP
jgi:hypothetical protein